MLNRIGVSLLFTTAILHADQRPTLNTQRPASNDPVLQPRQLDQLSRGKFQEIFSHGLSGENNAAQEMLKAASSLALCSTPLLEINVPNPGRFDNGAMLKAQRTFDHIAAKTPTPVCKKQ